MLATFIVSFAVAWLALALMEHDSPAEARQLIGTHALGPSMAMLRAALVFAVVATFIFAVLAPEPVAAGADLLATSCCCCAPRSSTPSVKPITATARPGDPRPPVPPPRR